MNGKGQAPSLHKLVEPSPAQEPPGRAAIPALQGPGSGRPDVLFPVSPAKGAPPGLTRVARAAFHYYPGRPRPLPTSLAPMSARCRESNQSRRASQRPQRATGGPAPPVPARTRESPAQSFRRNFLLRLPSAPAATRALPPRLPRGRPRSAPQTPVALPKGSWRSRACV